MVSPISYSFTPIEVNGKTILRPILQVILRYGPIEFPTGVLIDSGADYSVIQREIIEDAFKIDISKLKKCGETCGITGKTDVGKINVEMQFGTERDTLKEKIPFRVSLEPEKDTPITLLGRIPFFYKYHIDFRMGFTDDPTLGKFVIYPETHKRQAKRYKRPIKYGKKVR